MQTRAAILVKTKEPLVIDNVEVSEPKHGEVLVRMVASGVCHTDLTAMHGMLPIPIPTPIILGHEGAGVVEAVGPGVSKLVKGDHVVTAAVSHCRHCAPCLKGMPFFCNSSLELAWGGCLADGTKRFRKGNDEISHFFLQSSFAEFTVVP